MLDPGGYQFGRIVCDQGSDAESGASLQPFRLVHGPDRDGHVGFSGEGEEFSCDERIVERDLLGSEFVGDDEDVIAAAEEIHDRRFE